MCFKEGELRKGSHLAPNTLIQQYVSYDGSSARGKEIVREETFAEMSNVRKWGRAVLGDKIDEIYGEYVPVDEKETIQPDALTRDFLFCDNCENRFGYIESVYGDYFHKRKQSVNPVVSYLFWLSVFWRLSIASISIRLSDEDEEKMRKILDSHIPEDPKTVRNLMPSDTLNGFKYCMYHCNDIKQEDTGSLGNHSSNAPYRLIVGHYVIVMYPEDYDDGVKRHYNSYTAQEFVVEESFLDYWKHKRSILDEVWHVEHGRLNDVYSNIVDVIKADDSWEEKALTQKEGKISGLKGIDGMLVLPPMPGSVAKMLAWTKQHKNLSIEEQCKGITEELGYTNAEADYMYRWYFQKINQIEVFRVIK